MGKKQSKHQKRFGNPKQYLLEHRDPNVNLVDAITLRDPHQVKLAIMAGATVLPLNDAVRSDIIEIVRELINYGADVNMKDKDGVSALHLASRIGNVEIVRELVLNRADVNIMDNEGFTPLYWATKIENIAAVRELIRSHADVDLKYRGETLLQWAVKVQHHGIIDDLIAHLSIHWAARERHVLLAKEFIWGGADVNVKDTGGLSPLHWAVKTGTIDTAKELCKAGAVVDNKDCHGVTPLNIALVEGHTEILKELINHGARDFAAELLQNSVLHISASLGYDEMVVFLLTCDGFSANARDSLGRTLIHCAVQIGKERTIDNLVNAGVDLGALDNTGKSVLHLVASYGHSALIDTFVKSGLDPNATDLLGRSSLHYAVMYRQDECVQALLQKGSDPDLRDSRGKKPADYLQKCEQDSLTAKALRGECLGIGVLALFDQSYNPDITKIPDLAELSQHPGFGSVYSIVNFDMDDFIEFVRRQVREVISKAMTGGSDMNIVAMPGESPVMTMPGGSDNIAVIGCGSSFEGSKVGMPDELDFLVKMFSSYYVDRQGEGYGKMEKDTRKADKLGIYWTYGVWLWTRLMTYWSKHQNESLEDEYGAQKRRMQMPLPPARHPDRKTCTTWLWLYSDEVFQDLPVSIDFVPAIEVTGSHYNGVSTWRMTKAEISNGMSYMVPKIPYENSNISEQFEPSDLNQLGRISYPTLEVDHLKRLDQRVKAVFITAKCLRKPEVCGFKIARGNGEVVSVSEYLTSYRLKTVFLHLVEMFLKTDMSLGKMVVILYEQLERCIERGKLPMFFDPNIDVLAGSRLDRTDSLNVSRIMTRCVRSIYERDFPTIKDAENIKVNYVPKYLLD